jgi:tRNA 2-thiouridine synthesizing protein A
VLRTENRLADLPAGSIITVETTDPLSAIDIPHFCNQNGHGLLSQEKTDSGHRFVIRKKV